MELIGEPLGARVLLHRRKYEKSSGGIIIPDDAQKRYASLRCTVIKCGPACEWGLEPGDEVLIGRLAGTWINKDGKPVTDFDEAEYYLVMEDDILLKYTADAEASLGSLDEEINRANSTFKKGELTPA